MPADANRRESWGIKAGSWVEGFPSLIPTCLSSLTTGYSFNWFNNAWCSCRNKRDIVPCRHLWWTHRSYPTAGKTLCPVPWHEQQPQHQTWVTLASCHSAKIPGCWLPDRSTFISDVQLLTPKERECHLWRIVWGSPCLSNMLTVAALLVVLCFLPFNQLV